MYITLFLIEKKGQDTETGDLACSSTVPCLASYETESAGALDKVS